MSEPQKESPYRVGCKRLTNMLNELNQSLDLLTIRLEVIRHKKPPDPPEQDDGPRTAIDPNIPELINQLEEWQLHIENLNSKVVRLTEEIIL